MESPKKLQVGDRVTATRMIIFTRMVDQTTGIIAAGTFGIVRSADEWSPVVVVFRDGNGIAVGSSEIEQMSILDRIVEAIDEEQPDHLP